LYDAILIKDNHIDGLGGIKPCLEALPDNILQQHSVIIEVRTIEELNLVLTYGRQKVKRILLDNMSIEQLRQCVALCRGILTTEASGSINLTNIKLIAETGVDFASIGCLTYSPQPIDLSIVLMK